MSDDMDGLDMALLAKFAPRPSQTIKGRKALEKKRVAGPDRRAMRTTGRTAQLNLKVRQDFRDEIEREALARGVLMVELIERAWMAWKAGTA